MPCFTLQPNKVDLWECELDISTQKEADLSHLLSSDELELAMRTSRKIIQTRRIASRSALRFVLSQIKGCSPKDIHFTYNQYGKPFCEGITFNISHTGPHCIIACTPTGNLGVDIETPKPRRFKALAKRYFSTYEINALNKLPQVETQLGFYRIWTQKEAFIKAIGHGLHQNLSAFSVSATPPACLVEYAEGNRQHWHLLHVDIQSRLPCALASDQKIKVIQLRQLKQWGL